MIRLLKDRLLRFHCFINSRGQGTTEYVLILAVIVALLLLLLPNFRTAIATKIQTLLASLRQAG